MSKNTIFLLNFFVYCMSNEVALEAWLILDSCYLTGWNRKNPRGDPHWDHGEWGRCITVEKSQSAVVDGSGRSALITWCPLFISSRSSCLRTSAAVVTYM